MIDKPEVGANSIIIDWLDGQKPALVSDKDYAEELLGWITDKQRTSLEMAMFRTRNKQALRILWERYPVRINMLNKIMDELEKTIIEEEQALEHETLSEAHHD